MTEAPLTLAFAFALGLIHSLEPSHAKAVLASYFLNQKRTVREAVAFALTVTIAHTLTIFVMAIFGFILGPLMKGETVESWGEVLGGGLMTGIGIWMLAGEIKVRFHKGEDSCDHHHCGHDHPHGHFFHHHHYGHDHPEPSSMRQIFFLGFCSGAIPCMSGLAVLVKAWTSHSPFYGLLLVGVFSIGLGSVVLAMCLIMQQAAQFMDRYWKTSRKLSRLLPTLSSILILGMGLYILYQGLPEVMGTHSHSEHHHQHEHF